MTTTNDETTTTNAPTHIAYKVRNREGKSGIWTEIGPGYTHADGKGFTLYLDALPVDGKVTVRIASEKTE